MEVLRSLGLDGMRQRNYWESVINSTEYVAVADARWASVADDDDGDFIVLEVPPSLRGIVDICSLGGTPNPMVQGCGGIGTTNEPVD